MESEFKIRARLLKEFAKRNRAERRLSKGLSKRNIFTSSSENDITRRLGILESP